MTLRTARLSVTALSISGFVVACSPTPEPLGQAAVLDTMSPSASAPAEPTSAPTGPGGPIEGKLVEVEPSTDGSKDMHASITFENLGAGDCKVTAYTLEWPGGKKTVKVDDFVVHGKATAKRSMKMHPEDGKLESLKTADGTVTLKSDCPAPSASTRRDP